jgi:pre-mycofactocin synthase
MQSRRSTFATTAEARERARKALPRSLYEAVCSGNGACLTLRDNLDGFAEIGFRPTAGVAVAPRDLRTVVLGAEVALPVLIAPTGNIGLVHPRAELELARAAAAAGTIAVIAMGSSYPPEEVAAAGGGVLWQQLYLVRGRNYAEGVIERARDAGYRALVVTVDLLVDSKPGLAQPRFDFATARRYGLEVLARPRWLAAFLRAGPRRRLGGGLERGAGERPVSAAWSDFAWIRELWPGALVAKGILTPEDARRALDAGVDAVVVSNHGGKGLDSLPGSIRALPDVVAAVGDEIEVLLDGGIRTGSDVVKAISLGARAALVGQTTLFGLAVAGAQGVRRVLEVYRRELDTVMGLLGVSSVAELDGGRVYPPRQHVAGALPEL